MAHFHSKYPTRIPIEVIQSVGETLLAMKYASSFVIDEKSKRYELVWTRKGLKFAKQFGDIYHQSTNRLTGSPPALTEAIEEILCGAETFK
jgi:hypothetical protein